MRRLHPASALFLALALAPARAQPVHAQPDAAALPEAIPHLTGIVIGAGVREALFVGEDGATALVVEVGQQIGSFTVVAIRPGEAELAGPRGNYVIQPSPQLGRRSPGIAEATVKPLMTPAYREAVSETDQ